MEPMVASTGRLDQFIHRNAEVDVHGAVGTVHHRILTTGTGLEQVATPSRSS